MSDPNLAIIESNFVHHRTNFPLDQTQFPFETFALSILHCPNQLTWIEFRLFSWTSNVHRLPIHSSLDWILIKSPFKWTFVFFSIQSELYIHIIFCCRSQIYLISRSVMLMLTLLLQLPKKDTVSMKLGDHLLVGRRCSPGAPLSTRHWCALLSSMSFMEHLSNNLIGSLMWRAKQKLCYLIVRCGKLKFWNIQPYYRESQECC